MAFKMRNPFKQEGPVDKKNIAVQPSEKHDYVYEPSEKASEDKEWVHGERIGNLEERIAGIKEDVSAMGKPITEQQKKDIAKLEQELAILRKTKHR